MTQPLLLRTAAMCLLPLLFTSGCSSGGDHLVAVKGKVTFKGAPVPCGTIVFIPDLSRGTHGRLAMADIQPDGTFTLKTSDTLGAVAGWHRVTISSVQPAGPGQAPLTLLPPRYRDPQQSGLAYEVLPNKTNVFEIDLE